MGSDHHENAALGSNPDRSDHAVRMVEHRGSNPSAPMNRVEAGSNSPASKGGEATATPKPSAAPPPKTR